MNRTMFPIWVCDSMPILTDTQLLTASTIQQDAEFRYDFLYRPLLSHQIIAAQFFL